MPGPPTPMPLPQSFLAMLIPVIDPQRNGTAMHLQVISYFSRGLPIQAHQNPLDAQHYSRFLILLCLASNFQQLGDGGLISVRECWAHIAHHCSFFGVCRIIYAHLYRSPDGQTTRQEGSCPLRAVCPCGVQHVQTRSHATAPATRDRRHSGSVRASGLAQHVGLFFLVARETQVLRIHRVAPGTEAQFCTRHPRDGRRGGVAGRFHGAFGAFPRGSEHGASGERLRGDLQHAESGQPLGAADREAVAKAAPTPTPAPKEIQKTFGEQLEDLADSLEEPAVQEQIRTAKGRPPRRSFVVTGHSLGSALATLFVMKNKGKNRFDITTDCTFASPRVGETEFAEQFNQLALTSWR